MIPTIYDHCVPTVPEPWEASDSDNSPPPSSDSDSDSDRTDRSD